MSTDLASVDPNQLATLVLSHVENGNWRALAALGVVAIVFAIRTWLLAPAVLGRFKALAWFKSDKGGVALNFLIASLGGVGNALAAHAPITVKLLITSAVNACIAAGVFVSIKRLAGLPAAIPVAPVTVSGTIDTTGAPTVVPVTAAEPADAPKPEESK